MEFTYITFGHYQISKEGIIVGELKLIKDYGKIKAKVILDNQSYFIKNNSWFGDSKLIIESEIAVIGNINVGFWQKYVKIILNDENFKLKPSGLFQKSFYTLFDANKNVLLVLSNHQKLIKYNPNYKIENNIVNNNNLLQVISLFSAIYLKDINYQS